tara:strand:- start:989 stop:1420 length:432 start_codon:yes stop_codon:yes gene_type:complete
MSDNKFSAQAILDGYEAFEKKPFLKALDALVMEAQSDVPSRVLVASSLKKVVECAKAFNESPRHRNLDIAFSNEASTSKDISSLWDNHEAFKQGVRSIFIEASQLMNIKSGELNADVTLGHLIDFADDAKQKFAARYEAPAIA